ncbi:MAG: RnfABCDGE type electron transport complex subunit D, partial [Spirochaetales bacterium]|nr:RnfABCDGE type electron transport complex subunit D [Spirochaetales bacterium]
FRLNEGVDIISLLTGFRPGSMGESAIILILLAGIFLISTRTASWIIIVSTLGSAALLTFGLDLFGLSGSTGTIPGLLSGSFLFVTVFMATDPVSAPKRPIPQILYGIIIGTVSILVRTFSLFTEGTSFGVLVANVFGPLLDEIAGKKK